MSKEARNNPDPMHDAFAGGQFAPQAEAFRAAAAAKPKQPTPPTAIIFTEAILKAEAYAFLKREYGIPKDCKTDEEKDRWMGRYGLLLNFCDQLFPK